MAAEAGLPTVHNEYSYDAKRGNLVEIRHNTDGNAANDVVYSFELDALGRQTAVKVGTQTTGTLIHSATICRMHFPPSAAYKNLDLPQVNLRFLQLHLTKNSSTSRPPHLCGVTLTTEYVEYNESLQIKSQAPNGTCCKEIWQKVGRKKCSTNKPPQSAGLKREKRK